MHKCLKLTDIFKSRTYYCIMWLADYLDGQQKMLNINKYNEQHTVERCTFLYSFDHMFKKNMKDLLYHDGKIMHCSSLHCKRDKNTFLRNAEAKTI